MKYDIITLGSGVVDVFLETELEEKPGYLCLPTGYKIVVHDLWFSTGGGGTNTAVAFSRLGHMTGFVGCLGRDEHADVILNELSREKVKFLGSQGKELTGYSAVIDGKQKNRTVLTFKGANDFLDFKDIKRESFETKWIYFSSMVGKSFETQRKLSKLARSRGIKIAYNPSSYITRKGANYLKDVLKATEILILNKEEAQDLVGRGDMFVKLRSLGPKIVCITDGSNGNSVFDGSRLLRSKPRNIKIKERTGAGDAFASGFVSEMIVSQDLERAIKAGSLNAESVIQHYGAKTGLLKKSEMEKELRKNQIKVSEK